MMMSKVCTNPECRLAGQLQTLDSFYVNGKTATGRTARCKSCILESKNNAQAEERMRALANRDELPMALPETIQESLWNELTKLGDMDRQCEELQHHDVEGYSKVHAIQVRQCITTFRAFLGHPL